LAVTEEEKNKDIHMNGILNGDGILTKTVPAITGEENI